MRWTLFITDFRALMPRLPSLGRNFWNVTSNAPAPVVPMLAASDASRVEHGLPAIAAGAAGIAVPSAWRGAASLSDAQPALARTSALRARPPPFVFGVLSNFQKIDPAVFDVWCAILRRVPRSVLWLQRHNAAEVRVRVCALCWVAHP